MFNYPDIGPLSPTVGLERRKFEQMGVPPGQEEATSTTQGTPISSDLAQLIQLNRALQQRTAAQQQANPAPSTVAQDLMQMAMQQRAQQMAPQMDPRQQGIANIPQQGVGTRAMARGGIVAFNGEDESLVRNPYEFNMIDDAERRRAAAEAAAAKARQTPTTEQLIKTAARGGNGLAAFVPTLTGGAGSVSEYEQALRDMKIAATNPLAMRAKQREELETQFGIPAIRAAREAEIARREKDLSPEAQRAALMRNLSKGWASQIGQRGVPTSTRLAQMLATYGTARSDIHDQFKKATDELNMAKLDVREKNAMAQMTGALSDRKAAEDAQKQYMDALEKKAQIDAKTQEVKDTAAYRTATLKQGARELDLRAARDKSEAEHQKSMLEIQSGKDPVTRAKALLDSYDNKARSLTQLLNSATTMDPAVREEYQAELNDTFRRMRDVQAYVGKDIPNNPANNPYIANPLVSQSAIAAEKARRGIK